MHSLNLSLSLWGFALLQHYPPHSLLHAQASLLRLLLGIGIIGLVLVVVFLLTLRPTWRDYRP